MNDLMARVGYLFLHWGFLENELAKHQKTLSSLSATPGIEEARRIRHLIAHGIFRASADPRADAEPHLLCKDQNGSKVLVSYAQLGLAIEALERGLFAVRSA